MLPGFPQPDARRCLVGRDRLALVAVSLCVLIPGTLGVSLTDRDEGFYAQVSREMLVSGDWLVPHYLGEPWIFKPPLLYWLTAASFSVFGLNAFAARLVSVLAMTGVVQLVGTLGAEMYNRRVGLVAALAFLTMGLTVFVGRLLLTDPLLLLFTLGAALALWRCVTRGVTLWRAIWFWGCIGLGILAKGPAIILFVGGFALALLARPESKRWVWRPTLWLAGVVGIAVALPWYVYISHAAAGAFWQRFLWEEIILRVVRASCSHWGPPGYYLAVSLGALMPWTPLVPGAVLEVMKRRRGDRSAGMLLIWLAVPWVIVELMQSKLPHYVLPCYVPLAIILGRTLDVVVTEPIRGVQWVALWMWAVVPVVLGVALAVLGFYMWGTGWTPGAVASGVVLAGCYGGVAAGVARGSWDVMWRWAVIGAVVFHVAVGAVLLPGLERYRLSRDVAEAVNDVVGAAGRVVASGYDEPSMFFYMEARGRAVGRDEIPEVLAGGTDAEVAVLREATLRVAGAEPEGSSQAWRRIRGFNYVKGEWVVVWVVALEACEE